MSEDKSKKKVKGKVKAIAKGYFGGKIIHDGEVFEYEGFGKFPQWVKAVEEVKKAEVKKEEPKKEEPKKDEAKKSPFSSLV
jgi:hypothetical protein